MSCSLCRLPFTPGSTSLFPRPIPEGMLTDKQKLYMQNALGVCPTITGVVMDMTWLDSDLFQARGTPGVSTSIMWEDGNRTVIAFHTTCAALIRHRLDLTSDDADTLLDFALIDKIVGPTVCGAQAGMLKNFNYKTPLKLNHDGKPISIDIQSLWSLRPGAGAGDADFDWMKWRKRGLEWTAARPDVFPRFRPQVPPARFASLGPLPASTTDIFTTQPLDVLSAILPYLDDKSFMHLLATCRTLRHHALTALQPQARARVLALGWAVPVEWEYRGYVTRSKSETASVNGKKDADVDLAGLSMAHAEHSPVDADWHLYLSQVHRSAAMRARRWLWALAGELARVYRERREVGPYADRVGEDGKIVRSKAWEEYARQTRPLLTRRPNANMFKR